MALKIVNDYLDLGFDEGDIGVISPFSDQVNLDNIQYNRNSHWERSQKPDPGEEESLYNEKNYYYTFVHNI